MKSVVYFVLACAMGMGALFLLPYLAMGAHELLHPSPDISMPGTVLLFGFFALLFLGAIFMAYRLLRYAVSAPEK